MDKLNIKYRGKIYENFVLKYDKGKLEIIEIYKNGGIFESIPKHTIYTSIEKVEFITK